jgi:hypothetical protein
MAMNYGVKHALAFAEGLRDKYERNGKAVDAELKGAFHPPSLLQHLNDEQRSIAQTCLALETESVAAASKYSSSKQLLALVGGSSAAARAARAWAVKGSWVKLKSTSPFVSLSMKYVEQGGSKSR